MRLKRLSMYLLLAIAIASCTKHPSTKKIVLYEKGYFDLETGQTSIRPESERIRLEFASSLQFPEFLSIYRGNQLIATFQSNQYYFSNASFNRWECYGEYSFNYSSIRLKGNRSYLHFKVSAYGFPTRLEATGELVGIPVNLDSGAGCGDRLIMSSEE